MICHSFASPLLCWIWPIASIRAVIISRRYTMCVQSRTEMVGAEPHCATAQEPLTIPFFFSSEACIIRISLLHNPVTERSTNITTAVVSSIHCFFLFSHLQDDECAWWMVMLVFLLRAVHRLLFMQKKNTPTLDHPLAPCVWGTHRVHKFSTLLSLPNAPGFGGALETPSPPPCQASTRHAFLFTFSLSLSSASQKKSGGQMWGHSV